MLTTFVQWCNLADLASTGNYVKVPHSNECVPRSFVLDTQPKCIFMNSLFHVIQGLGKDAFTKRHSTEEQRGENVDGLDWNER